MPAYPTRTMIYRTENPKIVQYPLASGQVIKVGDFVALDSSGSLTVLVTAANASQTQGAVASRILGKSLSDSAQQVAVQGIATPTMTVIVADDETEFLLSVCTGGADTPVTYAAATYNAFIANSMGATTIATGAGAAPLYYKWKRCGTTATFGAAAIAGASADVYALDAGTPSATQGVFAVTETDRTSIGSYFTDVWVKIAPLCRYN